VLRNVELVECRWDRVTACRNVHVCDPHPLVLVAAEVLVDESAGRLDTYLAAQLERAEDAARRASQEQVPLSA
jgi:hypothetical protein